MLPPPSAGGFWTTGTLDPITTVAVVAVTVGVLAGLRRAPRRRTAARLVLLALAAIAALLAVDGWVGVYADALASVFIVRTTLLLLVVPALLAFADPLPALRAALPARVAVPAQLRRVGQVLGHPLLGPLVVPIVLAAVVFTPMFGLLVQHHPYAWLADTVLLGLGWLITTPLARSGSGSGENSLRFGLILGLGLVELLVDAIPGIALRLDSHLLPAVATLSARHAWTPTAVHDQQLAGAILWGIAELIDLPFLVVVFRQWVRADREEALAVDQQLDAEAQRLALRRPVTVAEALGEPEAAQSPHVLAPWWEQDASVFGDARSRAWRQPDKP